MIQRGFYGAILVYEYSVEEQIVRFNNPATGLPIGFERVYTASSANRWLNENLTAVGMKRADLQFEII